MVAAARRYGRVVSGGSQRVLEDYRSTVNKCWGGEFGTIKSINVNVGPLPQALQSARPSRFPTGSTGTCGSAPRRGRRTTPYRCSGSFNINGASWRSFSDYSGGGMTDWGAHHFGGATFAIDCRELQPEEVTYHDDDGKEWLTYRLSQRHPAHAQPARHGNLQVEGTPGEKNAKPRPVPTYKGEAASTATSSTASRPAKSRSAISNWPCTRPPSATWATSPTS